ncbi:type II secretion system F family protein [Candidatus Woesearchaeota archaeon]|nr:type II secretion system F family protein [Candidatus Woesearchaeota archaeon]
MVYRLFARIFPLKVRKSYAKLLLYSGSKVDPENYLGFVTMASLFIGLAGAFLLSLIYTEIPFLIQWLLLFLLIEILVYVPLMLKVDRIAREVETILSDSLQIMSSNLKSGLTVDQAILSSVRPEFGRFGKELDMIGKEVALGKPLERALLDSTNRIKSDTYRKTMELLSSGLRSGGELARLLDQTSANLKHQVLVDQKIRSNVMMYVIFIFSAICFGAPMLFGLSSFLAEVITDIFGTIDIPEAASSRFAIPILNFSSSSINTNFIMTYIIVSIIISSIMGGFIIGLISKGKEKYGFRYIPILITISLLMFFLVRLIIGNIMGDLINFQQ